MRLLVVTNDFPPTVGGIENYIYSLVRRWPSDHVVVVTRRVPGAEQFDAAQGFVIRRIETKTLLPTLSLLRSLRELVAREAIDAVHFPSSLPLGLLGPKLKRPYALSVHGGEFRLASRLPVARTVLKRVSRRASLMLPESTFASELVRGLIGEPAAMETVRCGVDVELYGKDAATPVDLGVDGPVIVCVSRMIARKGPRTLIRCLPLVRARHPDAHLLLVGGGPDLDHLKKLAGQNGVSSAVTFAGPQPWDRVPSYYSAGEVFALPTRARLFGTETEGLPLVLVEAAATGLPLVGGNVGGISDAVRDGETGFLVDGGSVEQTADALLRLLEDPATAERMGKAGRAMVEEEFHWDWIAARYRAAILEHCR